jgi:tetraacyldisaccharide 4'-kinase
MARHRTRPIRRRPVRAPDFWRRRTPTSALLWPFGLAFDLGGRIRQALATPWQAPIPVICVGNLVAGGAGKTPVALALGAYFHERRRAAHFLTRGYGGRLSGPVRVDPAIHDSHDVGDEPLLLAAVAPTWVARDRRRGAEAAAAAGAEILILDDGLQNPSIAKNFSFLVIDGGYGFGNGRVIPSGPLREPIDRGLKRVQAAVVIGDDRAGVRARLPRSLPLLAARLVPDPAAMALAGRKVVAFAGIGRPEKFFETLVAMGCILVEGLPFPDHHDYRPEDVMLACDLAAANGAVTVTTMKDYVRLPRDARAMVQPVPVTLEWENPAALAQLLSGF